VYDERSGTLIRQEPDPHTAQIVRDAARDVLAGASLWSVAVRLQDAGELTPMKPWSEGPRGWDTHTVRQVLQNPAIAGKRVYRGEVFGEADWEPLICWEDFQHLQRLFADPGRRVKGGGAMSALAWRNSLASSGGGPLSLGLPAVGGSGAAGRGVVAVLTPAGTHPIPASGRS
jgi:hypothetical protein